MSASSPFWDTDPFRIGQRYRTEVRADGRLKAIPVPLTEEDFLYPQPDDQFTGNVQHGEAMWYLYHAVGCGIRGRAGFRCFTRLSLDWQRAGMRPNAPDVSVFEDFVTPFATNRHTLPVLDSGAKPVLVIEVTVPSTRHLDLEVKWAIYHAAGVP